MILRIRIEHGQNAGHAWRLAEPGVYVLGRTPAASLQILDMKVSKDHCRFIVRAAGQQSETLLQDGGSRHGTELNGQQVATRKTLKPGDEIRIGLTILRVLSDDPGAETAVPTGRAEKEQAGADAAAGTPQKKRRTYARDALVGTEVGGYRVIEKIGQGGMGSVYTAEQLSLNREVALKVLSKKFTSDSAFVDQFVNEARSAAALNHPNVVQVYDVGRQNGTYYFSMEFVTGGSLEERIAESGAQDWREALNWMIDASNALIFAQKRDILHRDVKPDNLMLAEDGSAKLCDLGLAKKASNADMLAAGIVGTPAFISPEAIRRKKDIDVRSDLYSLGCTFYRVLTGENPYPAKTVKEILIGHLKAPVPRASAKQPNVPRDLDDVLFKLMQKEPEERFATPQDVLQALDRIRVQHGLEAHGLQPASRKPLIIALIAVLVLGGGALAFLLSRGGTTITVESKEAQEKAARQQQELEEGKYTTFVAKQEKALADLDAREARGNLRFADHWADDLWPTLIADYETLAGKLETNEKYGSRDEVKNLGAMARGTAARTRKYVELRRGLDETVKTARKGEAEAVQTGISKRRADFDTALQAADWLKAWQLVDREALEALIRPYVERQVLDVLPDGMSAADRAQFEGSQLLVEEKHIRPVVERHLPGDPVGEDLRGRVLDGARQAHEAFTKRVSALLAKKTEEAYAEALEQVEAHQEALPTGIDAQAGELGALLQGFADELDPLLETIQDAELRLRLLNQEHDQIAYGMLLQALRSPQGLLFRFRFDEAQKLAGNAAKGMRYAGYQVLARQAAEDVAAFETLFGHLVATYPSGWSRDRITWVDEEGRERTEKVKGLTRDGIDVGGDVVPFEKLGPAWILQYVFRDKDGGWRFALEGEDHRGLAVLAELAVDYDEVVRQYQAYTAWLPADRIEAQQAIRARLGQKMLLERQAGEAWRTATENLAQVRSILDAHDPALIGEDAFWDDQAGRAAFVERKRELSELLDAARRAQATLLDPRYATTVWGTAVRGRPVAGVRYAGEPVIEVAPAEEPKQQPEPPEEPKKEGGGPEGGNGDGKPEDAPEGGDGGGKPEDAPGDSDG